MTQNSSSQTYSLTSTPNVSQQFLTYQKQSNFIHEYNVPLDQRGLKGITTDSHGNPWFYHQANHTSMIIKFNFVNNTFNYYPIQGRTVTDIPIINLAGGQLIFDQKRNGIWFTDARVNSIGMFDIKSGRTSLYRIPTNNSGVMGILLSPDNTTLWFTEIIGNKIGSFDIDSKTILEYPTGNYSGPTLLSFDDNGVLWVTLSYSNSILKIEPWMLVPQSRARGISEIKLDNSDAFSPFGIAIAMNKNNQSTIFVSDHGSSRVIVSDLDSELKNYSTYWTSPSQELPASLPSQVVSDKLGNIYFVEHGGNRISKISKDSGLMTEFDIPTGILATVVYLAVSPDSSKVWFTEWASNRIAYLDNSIKVPLKIGLKNPSPIILTANQTYPLDIQVTKDNISTNKLVSFNGIEVSVIGMTDSGLEGLSYFAKPQRFNLIESTMNGRIDLAVDADEAIAGKYTVMPRVSMLEKDNLTISMLQPLLVSLDIPDHEAQTQNLGASEGNDQNNNLFILLRDLARYGSIAVALVLIGYLIRRKVRRGRRIAKNRT
jgi:virginiamycin B lyase